jgi:hypothetical protein
MTAGQPPDVPEPIPGQMDVYEVLAEIAQEPEAKPPPGKPRRLTAAEVVAQRLRQETS